jgi:3-dehydroshikimate dehydratase
MSDVDLENELNFFLQSQKKKPIFNLSALLSGDIETQLDALEAEDLRFIEVGEVGGKNIIDLSNAELDEVQAAIQMHGLSVSALATPIGSSDIREDFAPHFARFERTLEVADWLGTSYIRIFGFGMPEKGEAVYRQYRAEVARRLTGFAVASQPYGLILLLENAPGTFGDTAEHCADLIDEVGSTNLRSLLDPAALVQVGDNPLIDAYPSLQEQINLLHLRDARSSDGTLTPLGAGDGEIKELLRAMWQNSYQGSITLNPTDGSFGGQTFSEAVRTVRQMLTEIEQEEGGTRNKE